MAQVQSRQVDQGTQAGKICTEKDASVGAGVRYSNICIDRLGGQRYKFAIARVPVIFIGLLQSLLLQLSTLRFLQFASTSSVPAGRKRGSIGRGVRGVKLVMVSAVSASSWRFRGRGARARTFEATAALQVERHEGGAFGERFERPWGKQWAEGPEVSVNFHWWSRPSLLQLTFGICSSDAERL